MTTSKATPSRDLLALTPAQIAARLILLQSLILRVRSGHGPGGNHPDYLRRAQLRRDLDCRHLFHWQILRGVTAIGFGAAVWLPDIRDLATDLCAADGIRCWIDPTHAVADKLIDAGEASLTPDSIMQPDEARRDLMREASALAPTVNLARPSTSPVVIFTPAWADYFGSRAGLHGNDGFLELAARFRLEGFRVVILCHDAYAFARQYPGVADYVLPLRGMGDWVFRKLCTALCGHARPWLFPEPGALFSAATPAVLNTAWKPGMSPEVLRLMILQAPRPKPHAGGS